MRPLIAINVSPGRSPIRFAGHYTFTPAGDSSTKFTSVDESEPSGLLRYLQPLLQPFAQRQITSNLAQLKAVIEAQTVAGH